MACVCACVQLRWHRYLHMHIIVFCALLHNFLPRPPSLPMPASLCISLFILQAVLQFSLLFVFLICTNKWEIRQKIHDASDSVCLAPLCTGCDCCSSCWFGFQLNCSSSCPIPDSDRMRWCVLIGISALVACEKKLKSSHRQAVNLAVSQSVSKLRVLSRKLLAKSGPKWH